ncbi:nineteen complex-related protein 2-domain-containing protein [Halteromyces radiatus]|uniref:nineteen complex-related protein 2-domain-containing protein n=1 Tax=Halteromyces radiatus TaxID=101107 RepID=UPI00221FEB23|nr:nineteen complex-related protein 2-domain-containing protein [Halteromyces radiatus]KAI8076838.1 nineteen complex-related protein 2-domain-containing protein [Halteromyces radiatus]
MFKKPNRTKNIRRKIETSDDETKPDEEPVVSNTILKSKSDKKKSKNKSLGLSFDHQDQDDVDGEVFQVKKSKASRKLASARKLQLEADTTTLASEDSTTPSTYNDDYLASLRASTPALPPTLRNATNDDGSTLLAEKFPKTMTARLGDMTIPDSNAIHAAKKKRELMRQGVVVVDHEQGFVALDDTSSGSRLVREEDDIGDDGEGDYEKYVGEQITLDKKEAKKQELERLQNAREMILDAQDEADDSGSDDSGELDRWEKDLIKHGGVRTKYEEPVVDPFATPRGYQPAIIPEAAALPTLDDVLKRLDFISSDITLTMQQYESQLSDAKKGMMDLNITGDDLDREIQHGSKRYDYFQSLSNTVNDLGEFLDVKIPELEKLEKDAHDIIAAKQEIVQERRWLEDMDLLLSFAVVPEHLLETDQDTDDMDEFGRSRVSKLSEAARQRRSNERQQRIEANQSLMECDEKEIAFWSDDDLQDGWIEKRDQKLDDIQFNKMDELFDDVSDDFKSLEAVKSFFEAWKTDFYEDYKNAFGSLSLPAAFEFYIRCELVAWNPFSDPIEFDTMKWHSTLSKYGIIDGVEGHEDADVELLNKVVDKVIIKKIKGLLDTMNPASSKETRYAVQVAEQVSYYVDKHERSFQELMMQVEKVIEKPLLRYAQIVESATLMMERQDDSSNNKKQFVWRQLKYLKNLILWRRYIPRDNLLSLGKLIVHRIVAPLLKPGLVPGDSDLENEALTLYARLE